MSVISDFYPAFAELDEYEAFSVLATVETAVIGGEDDVITPIKHTDRSSSCCRARTSDGCPTAATWGSSSTTTSSTGCCRT